MMGGVGQGDVNRAPRRWVDRAVGVRVVEGWHPSRPDVVGYNLLLGDAWFGTFDSLEEAAEEAGRRLPSSRAHGKRRKVILQPC